MIAILNSKRIFNTILVFQNFELQQTLVKKNLYIYIYGYFKDLLALG